MTWNKEDSAPKTGEHILVAIFPEHGFGKCGGKFQSWMDVVHYWDNPGEEGFYMSNGPGDFPVNFTHWMPLPDLALHAPEVTEKDEV